MSLPPSAVALGAVLDADDSAARRIRARVHRTALWKYTTGRRLPDLKTATILEALGGMDAGAARVPANGWVLVARRAGRAA